MIDKKRKVVMMIMIMTNKERRESQAPPLQPWPGKAILGELTLVFKMIFCSDRMSRSCLSTPVTQTKEEE